MNPFYEMIMNFPLICAGTAWIAAQIIKIFTGIFKLQSFTFTTMMFGTGGMPSSHTAAVCALMTACALSEGFGSIAFAITAILTMIVIRDATGVRREVGEHAKALNLIMADLVNSTDHASFDKSFKELVGHTGTQVFAGAIVGFTVPFLMSMIPVYGIWA